MKLDGRDLKTLNVTWLRQQIKLVQQEPVLFSATVRQNIEQGLLGSKYENGTPEVKLQMVIDAAKIANAYDFITKLPEGFDTMCGQGGGLLSGGELS